MLLSVVARVIPLVVVLPAVEAVVGINSTNMGCWCVVDFFNLRPDNGVSCQIMSNSLS